ncbi:hypothetical protein [Rhizobium sp. BT-226]|uniref:hypothetical protein n=1 Tax=Rhizobium sp. BT-226 TaxID=2986922 RepID=UPI0021F722ED|nr:hypothetical protein [Rhizobium sp. BT-226]MCW0016264.1 hypothetical protein [Rhizobium sp. BT-226]
MRDIYEKYATWIALTLFVIVACIALYGFRPTFALLPSACGSDDKGACFREWVAATSGWFAGALAFVTLLAIRRQIQLQQRQIDFQLGDSKPTMYAMLTTDDYGEPMIRFVIENHNRRTLMLSTIAEAAVSPSVVFTVRRCFVNDVERPLPMHHIFEGLIQNCIIPGRVEGHPTPKASLICKAQAKLQSDQWDPADELGLYVITAACHGILADEDSKPVIMKTRVHLLLPWPGALFSTTQDEQH